MPTKRVCVYVCVLARMCSRVWWWVSVCVCVCSVMCVVYSVMCVVRLRVRASVVSGPVEWCLYVVCVCGCV